MEQKRQELIQHLQSAEALTHELRDQFMSDAPYRKEIMKLSRGILQRTQAPPERAWELFTYPSVLAATRVALEAGWLDHVAKAGPAGINVEKLAENTASDPVLATRILRLLATDGILDEVGVKCYGPNDLTGILTATKIRSGIEIFSDLFPSLGRMHLFFDNSNHQDPSGATSCPYAFTEGMVFWKKLDIEPRRAKAFNQFMDGHRIGRADWFDTYPIADFKLNASGDILLIDVAGGIGHDLVKFNKCRTSKGLSGRLVLQDQPHVLAQIPEDWKHEFTALTQDFFKPQPDSCRDARVYYLRTIIHDWADAPALTILGHIRDAMKPGYSTLLLNDIVLPDSGCPFWAAAYDAAMMTMVGGKERTLQEWHDLIERVDGLKIEKIHTVEDLESVIEITRVEK